MRAAVISALAALSCLAGASAARADAIGDPVNGAKIYDRECARCHMVGPEAKDRIGPALNGIFGRRAAASEGFAYSKSITRMGNDGLTWTLETLDAYVENPKALVSGTRMNYRGLRDAAARGDVLAYLREYSDKPQNIPEAEPTARPSMPALSPEVLALKGDRDWGEYLSAECLTCHKRDGADEGIPGIVQWPEENFVIAMHAYKQGLRPHPVMQMMAARLSNEEIAALAAYFATID